MLFSLCMKLFCSGKYPNLYRKLSLERAHCLQFGRLYAKSFKEMNMFLISIQNFILYFIDVFKRARGLGPFLSMFITFVASSILHVRFVLISWQAG